LFSWMTMLTPLIAAAEPKEPQRWEGRAQYLFQDTFRDGGRSFPMTSLVLVGLGLLLLLGAIAGWRWHQRRHARPAPLGVFHRLAAQMGLTLKEEWLLVKIARHQSIPTPLTLLLSGSTFAHHVKPFLEAASGRRRRAITAKVHVIAVRLFDRPFDT
jgi:hypothetical protein